MDNEQLRAQYGSLMGATVIRRTDWRKGRKGPLGRVENVFMSPAWNAPKARVQWLWHQTGGIKTATGMGLHSTIAVDALQVVEVTASQQPTSLDAQEAHA